MDKKRLDELLAQGHITKSEYDSITIKTDSKLVFRTMWLFCLLLVISGSISLLVLLGLPENTTFMLLGVLGISLSQFSQSSLNPASDSFIRSSLFFLGALLGTLIFIPALDYPNATAFVYLSFLIYFLIMGNMVNSTFLITLSGLQILPLISLALSLYDKSFRDIDIYLASASDMPIISSTISILLAMFFYSLSTKSKGRISYYLIIYSRVMVVNANLALLTANIHGSEDFLAFFPIDIVWPILLLVALYWGLKNKHRWLVATSIIFLATYLYAQILSHLGSSPIGLILTGFSGLAVLKVFTVLTAKERYIS